MRERPRSNWPASERAKKKRPSGEEGEEGWGLELEAPSGLAAAGAEDEEDGDDDPEGDEDAEGVDEAVAAEAAALFAGGLDEREAFEEENREDAGHQVEDDAAEEGEADGAEDGDAAGLRCAGALLPGAGATSPGVTGAVTS